MKKRLLTTALIVGMGSLPLCRTTAQTRLVVSLTIDQLRTDYMEAFTPLYGSQGFKRLMKEGRVYDQVSFSFQAKDRAAATAAIYTGAPPSLNGIVAQSWMDAETRAVVPCVDDPAFMGNNTNESSSPSKLLVSTVADELKVATRGLGLVYAIAPFRDAAILSAGHAANCAFWLSEQSGLWCSTTYYKDYPWWLNQYNDTKAPAKKMRSMAWTPSLPMGSYQLPPDGKDTPFKHNLNDDTINRYRHLAASPLVNDEVNLLAEELLGRSDMGKDNTPDFLSLTFYGGNFNHKSTGERSLELQDTYARLDKSIGDLLAIISKHVGLQHVLFCVSSTGYTDPEPSDPGSYRIPSGEFFLNRCATLLNVYLMATYGTGDYVQDYHDLQIFLNRRLVEEKQLNMADVEEKAAQFLAQFSGVNEVYSSYKLLLNPPSEQSERVRNGFHRKHSGNLLIEVLPGWKVVDDRTGEERTVTYAAPASPFFMLGGHLPAGRVSTPVRAERIAPTIANTLHIRAPNACREPALP